MRVKILTLSIIALLMAACSAAAPQPEASSPTQAIQPTQPPSAPPTEAPTATTELSPTDIPAAGPSSTEAPAAGGVMAYQIIPGDSQLKYEVGEVFFKDNNRFNLAVGVTPQVTGEILVDMSAPQNSQIGTISADISQFQSDSSRRDNAIRQRFIETSRYPIVTFTPTAVEGLPEAYSEGQEIPLKISGDLTIREVTRPVTFDALVKLEGGTLNGSATTTILMSEFGFGPIDILGTLKTEDEAKVTLSLVARP